MDQSLFDSSFDGFCSHPPLGLLCFIEQPKGKVKSPFFCFYSRHFYLAILFCPCLFRSFSSGSLVLISAGLFWCSVYSCSLFALPLRFFGHLHAAIDQIFVFPKHHFPIILSIPQLKKYSVIKIPLTSPMLNGSGVGVSIAPRIKLESIAYLH